MSKLVRAIAEAAPGALPRGFETPNGEGVAITAEHLIDVLAFLRDDPAQAFEILLDITAIDREQSDGVIEVIYVLRSLSLPKRALLKVRVRAADPRLPSATDLWPSANWAEREVYDMFGVQFEGHPGLCRILMYEEFEGYPLRKSYDYRQRQPLVPERDPISNPWPKRGLSEEV